MDIDRARERFGRRLWLRWPEAFDGPQGMGRFEELLKPYLKGPCAVGIAVNRPAILRAAASGRELVGAALARASG